MMTHRHRPATDEEHRMSSWMSEARVGAARAFGARHYRTFAAGEAAGAVGRRIVPIGLAGLVVAAVLAARAGVAGDLSAHVPWGWVAAVGGPIALIIAARTGLLQALVPVAVAAALAAGGWALWRAAGHVHVASTAVLVVLGVLVLVGAWITGMLLPVLGLSAIGGLAWLAWTAVVSWSMPWPAVAGTAIAGLLVLRALRRLVLI
jgi:hypothetical protein